MIKIGILGSDNSHALEFAKLANIPHDGKIMFDDVRVTHIYGHKDEDTQRVVAGGNIPNIVTDPAQMLAHVDAVMVVFRDGVYHYKYALPFIQKGMPVWIDKPITVDLNECRKLVDAAKKYKSPLSGGSNCKLAGDIAKIRNYVDGGKKEGIKTALINFPIYLDSIYSGMHFYAAHLVEMTTEIFGLNVKGVYARINGANINAMFEYNDYDIHLCFSRDTKKYSCTLVEEQENTFFDISINDIASNGFADFVKTIRTRTTTYTIEYHYRITELVEAIKRSTIENRRIVL